MTKDQHLEAGKEATGEDNIINGDIMLKLESTGALVLYDNNQNVWSTPVPAAQGDAKYKAEIQSGGFVVCKVSGDKCDVIWSNGIAGGVKVGVYRHTGKAISEVIGSNDKAIWFTEGVKAAKVDTGAAVGNGETIKSGRIESGQVLRAGPGASGADKILNEKDKTTVKLEANGSITLYDDTTKVWGTPDIGIGQFRAEFRDGDFVVCRERGGAGNECDIVWKAGVANAKSLSTYRHTGKALFEIWNAGGQSLWIPPVDQIKAVGNVPTGLNVTKQTNVTSLPYNQALEVGEGASGADKITGDSGITLKLEANGSLVLYDTKFRVWATREQGPGRYRLEWREPGTLVVCRVDNGTCGGVIWNAGVSGGRTLGVYRHGESRKAVVEIRNEAGAVIWTPQDVKTAAEGEADSKTGYAPPAQMEFGANAGKGTMIARQTKNDTLTAGVGASGPDKIVNEDLTLKLEANGSLVMYDKGKQVWGTPVISNTGRDTFKAAFVPIENNTSTDYMICQVNQSDKSKCEPKWKTSGDGGQNGGIVLGLYRHTGKGLAEIRNAADTPTWISKNVV